MQDSNSDNSDASNVIDGTAAFQSTPVDLTVLPTHDPKLDVICQHLNTLDFNMAQLAIALKDPDKKQEIGMKLVDAIKEAIDAKDLEFSNLKLSMKGGILNVGMKFPLTAIVRRLK